MENLFNRCQIFAPVLLRIGLSLVFLWFGFNQFFNPEMFLGYVPQQVAMLMYPFMQSHHLLLVYSAEQASLRLIMFNGIFEVILGMLLLLGLFTRITAGLLALHLLSIAVSLGYNDVMIRDGGLMIALVSIVLHGPDQWCLGKKG